MMSTSAVRPLVVEGLRLITMVGRGGEGEVWEARDRQDRRRALKLVRPDCLASPRETIARGRWLVRIDHPALVRVHRSGLVSGGVLRSPVTRASRRRSTPRPLQEDHALDGWGFVEMDFIAGESLATAEADPSVLERLEPLSEALDLLHAGAWSDGVPLVHRDVKPANIVEDRDGRFVLVDPSTLRGLDADDVTRVGTPLFRAPEVLAGHTTTAADVYSFAATIVALATGLRGRDLANLLRDPNLLGLPRGVRQALSPEPGQRPVSCRAVLEQGETMTLPVPVVLPWEREGPDGEEPSPGEGNGQAHEVEDDGADRDESGEWLAAQGGLLTSESGGTWIDHDQHSDAPPVPSPAPPPPEPVAAPSQAVAPPAGGRSGWPPPAVDGQRALRRQQAGAGEQSAGWLGPAAHRPTPLVGALLAVVAAAVFLVPPAIFFGDFVPPEHLMVIFGGALAVHLVVHIVFNRPLLLAIVLPPVAWSGLIADRIGGSGSRRAWSRALLLPGCAAMAAATPLSVLARAQAVGLVGPEPPVSVDTIGILLFGGFAGLALALGAAGVAGGAGALLRVLALPLWALGAATLLALCAVGVLPALLVGRARKLLRVAGDTLASLGELARPPRAAGPAPPTLGAGRR